PLALLNSRVKALFAANSALSGVTRGGLKKLHHSALSLSKYLTALYVASFLFLLSSHEQISTLTGGNGAGLWAMLVVLACLAFEAKRSFKLFVGSETREYVEKFLEEIMSKGEELDP